ncbi:MAG: hypothetical protein JWM36_4045 [Hyphomicrobiales bacterium]|nr:hypothetical protein [Hyphomicrobiales bacterium]
MNFFLPHNIHGDPEGRAYLRTIWGIALGILVFAGGVVVFAHLNGLRQLLKDGLDWGYDVVLYGLAAVVYGRSARAERICAIAIGAVMAVAGVHTLYDLWDKIGNPRPIEPATLEFSAITAAASGFLVVGLLLRFRHSENPLIQATWLSSRNSMLSTAVYSFVSLFARLATSRLVEYGLDVFAAVLCFQAAWVILRDVMRDSDKQRARMAEV